MSKSKHAKPDEFHLETIRAQKKQIKRLQQELKNLNKQLNYNQTKDKSEKKSRKINICAQCGKGERIIMDIGIRSYNICTVCKDRERI